MYEVLLERHAKKDLRRLPETFRRKIVGNLHRLGAEPRPPNSRKLSGSENDHRLRVGQYREIDDDERLVRVFRIKQRRDAYRLFIL